MKDYEVFAGYVLTRGKAAITPFKDKSKLLSYQEVCGAYSYGGVLADGYILIDVDDKEQSDKLLDIVTSLEVNCLVYETNRGKHFILKNDTVKRCSTHTSLACGISSVDIKVGNAYSILKLEGVERKVLREPDTYDTLPAFMLPVRTNVMFNNLQEGEGRNDALFKHVTTLGKAGLLDKEIELCIKLINAYEFSQPLSDDELEHTVLRREYVEEVSKENTEKTVKEKADKVEKEPESPFHNARGKFLFYKFGDYILENSKIVRINGDIFTYKEGEYINGTRILEQSYLNIYPLNDTQRKEVNKYIDLKVNTEVDTDANYICLANGTYNLKTDTLEEWSPEHYVINKIDVAYDPEAYCGEVDTFLNQVANNNENIRTLLEEVIGYSMYRRNEFRKAIVLIGEASCGKSTYLKMLRHFVGEKNISSLDLNELDKKFLNAELSGKLLNVGDDISSEYIQNPAVFKKVVTGETMQVERKGQNPFALRNYSKLIFSANEMPRIKEAGGGISSRLMFIPFKAVFGKDVQIDREIIDKLITTEAKQYLLKIGIAGLKRLLSNGGFTQFQEVKQILDDYKRENDSVLTFTEDVIRDENLVGQKVNEVYTRYTFWCESEGLKAVGKTTFVKKMLKLKDLLTCWRSVGMGRKERLFELDNTVYD